MKMVPASLNILQKWELDHELAATCSTATCSVYSSNKVDKPVQTILTAEDWGTAVKVKDEEEWSHYGDSRRTS